MDQHAINHEKQRVRNILTPLASEWVAYFILGSDGIWSGAELRPGLVELGGIGSGSFGWIIGGEKVSRCETYYGVKIITPIEMQDSMISLK